MSKQEKAKRGPRTFSLPDENPIEERPVKATSSEGNGNKTASKAKVKRKPKVAKEAAVLRVVPDEAAQRIDPLTLPDDALLDDLTPPPPVVSKRRFAWSRIFWAALTGLMALALGLWVDQLIRDLFARQDWLGWLAVGLAGLLVLAALAILFREIWGLSRMARIDSIRLSASQAWQEDNIKKARGVLADLEGLYSNRADTAAGRASLAAHANDIIDGKNLIALAERDLISPLDQKARNLVMGSARRVSVVTAVSPRAIVDIGYVLVENIRLMRRIADLYGGRPGTFGFWRLARNVIGHLAVTGTIAVGDGLVQQLVGQGIAARISARLGEGVVNGLLTARIGIAAIDVCRPLPFSDQTRPSAKDFMGELMKTTKKPDD